jgi:hypothetical protein
MAPMTKGRAAAITWIVLYPPMARIAGISLKSNIIAVITYT